MNLCNHICSCHVSPVLCESQSIASSSECTGAKCRYQGSTICARSVSKTKNIKGLLCWPLYKILDLLFIALKFFLNLPTPKIGFKCTRILSDLKDHLFVSAWAKLQNLFKTTRWGFFGSTLRSLRRRVTPYFIPTNGPPYRTAILQGPVSRKSRELFGPEKPFLKTSIRFF